MIALRLAAFALLLLALPARAQVVEYDIPTEYTLYPDRLAVTFTPDADSADALAVIDEMALSVLETDFRTSTAHTVLAAPLTHSARARLAAEPAVRDVYVEALAFDRYLVVVELVPDTNREQGLALLHDLGEMQQAPGWQPARRDLVVAVAENEQDAVRERLEAHPLVDYVSYVAQP